MIPSVELSQYDGKYIEKRWDLRAGIAIEQGLGLDELFAFSTSFAFVCIVRITQSFGVEIEQLS